MGNGNRSRVASIVSSIVQNLGMKVNSNIGEKAEVADIFLFNHFLRSETVIVCDILERVTGKYPLAIAFHRLFELPLGIGRFINTFAIKDNSPTVIDECVLGVLSGRKLVIFPEGGIVRSKESIRMREGAARIGHIVEEFRSKIRKGDITVIAELCEKTGLTPKELEEINNKDTVILPSNINLFPMRGSGKTTGLLSKFLKEDSYIDEVVTEFNMITKNTTWNILSGEGIVVKNMNRGEKSYEGIMARYNSSEINPTRESYQSAIRSLVTINVGHLGSMIVDKLYRSGAKSVNRSRLLSAIKSISKVIGSTHPSLEASNVGAYLDQWIGNCSKSGLINRGINKLVFTRQLSEVEDGTIRSFNTVVVLANEVRDMDSLQEVVDSAINEFDLDKSREMGREENINVKATGKKKSESVVLCHGWNSTQASVDSLTNVLIKDGYDVTLVGLDGHGTVVQDMEGVTAEDWKKNYSDAVDMAKSVNDTVHYVGFSMGALLSGLHSIDNPPESLTMVCPPLKLRGLHNRIKIALAYRLRNVSFISKILPSDTSNPETNYGEMHTGSLHELSRLGKELSSRFSGVSVDGLVVCSSDDPLVDNSTTYANVKTKENIDCIIVESMAHSIIGDNIGNVNGAIRNFLNK